MNTVKNGLSADPKSQPGKPAGSQTFTLDQSAKIELARIRRIEAEIKALKPRLKKWTKKLLERDDWDFSEIFRLIEKKQAVRPEWLKGVVPWRAFGWEVDRELGSGNGPFMECAGWDSGPDFFEPGVLHLGRENGEVTHVQIETPPWANEPIRIPLQLHTWPLGKLAQLVTPDTIGASRESYSVYAIELPLLEDDDDVVEAFRLWLGRVRRGSKKRPAKRTGRKPDWRSRFTDLAIHRLSSCGYRRSETLKFLKLLNRSAPNFARSKRTARSCITERFHDLLREARVNSERWPGVFSSDWRKYFAKP